MHSRASLSAVAAASLAAALAAAAAAGPLDSDLLSGLRARSIGPAGMSGRVAAIDAVEADPDTLFVGAATGGIWKSTDGGLVWKPLFDDQPVAAIGALAIFQPNPAIVWAGTGEGNVRNSVSIGDGVYRSVDGGATWKNVGLGKSERIHRIALHPSDPDVAWVAALGPLWSDGSERGVFKTTDGGRSWRKVLYVDEKTGAADVQVDPGNPNRLLASTWQFRRTPWSFASGGPGSGLWQSDDGGETWSRLEPEDGLPEGELGRVGLAFARSNPSVVYALVEAKKSALLRSDDGGRTFRTVNDRYDVNPRPFYFGEIRVDPRDADKVYSLDYTVRVSTDGGKSFATVVRWDEIHGDHHAMWIDPQNTDHFYVGNDGGVAVTRDGGRNNRFVANLPLAQYYHVAVDLDVPYNVYGGLQDNGSWRGPVAVDQQGGIRNHFWKMVGFGDGFEVLPDPTDSRRGWALWQGGNLQRFDLASGELKDVKPAPPEETKLRFNWNAALAVDPFDPATIYLGSQFVHRSADRGESWTIVSPDLTTNDPAKQKQAESGGLTPDVTAAENHTTLVTIEPSRRERGLIWTGSDDGRLHLTRDGGATWSSVEKNVKGVPAGTWIPAIQASPHAAGTAFVVFDNHRRGDFAPYVARTDDFGGSWRSLVTSDLRGYALAIVQDPVDPDLLFLGTELGLWVSTDGGAAWSQFRQGLPTVGVHDLALHPRDHDLVIATHGRALYVIDDISPLRGLTAAQLEAPLALFSPPPARQHWREGEDGGFGFGAGEFRGENRPYGALISFVAGGTDLPLADPKRERERQVGLRRGEREGTPPVEKSAAEPDAAAERAKKRALVEIRDAAGTLVRTLRVEPKRGLNRVVWDLGRDAFRAFPPEDPEEKPNPNPSGPEVAPGSYDVTVTFRGQEAKTRLEVTADPSAGNDTAAWRAREAAIAEAGRLNDAAVAAVERIRALYRDLDAIAERQRAARADELARGDLAAAELPFAAEAKALRAGLAEVERRFWVPRDTVGIVDDEETAASRIGAARYYLTSSWSAPNANQLEYLRRARATLEAALDALAAFEAKQVAEFRAGVAAAGVGLLAEPPALPRP